MAWPTYTSPGVVFYGIAMFVVFIFPIGIIKAMTGVEVTLAILAEFIGGSLVPGNALAMNYMKAYGGVFPMPTPRLRTLFFFFFFFC